MESLLAERRFHLCTTWDRSGWREFKKFAEDGAVYLDSHGLAGKQHKICLFVCVSIFIVVSQTGGIAFFCT